MNKSEEAVISIKPVILCGGSGTRLWPLSRTGFPKQFLCLTGRESLFQLAVKRLMCLGNEQIHVTKPYVVTNEEHRFLALEQLREMGVELGGALLEPLGRNTAPALTLAALAAVENGDDPILVVTPADQTVTDLTAFTLSMRQAVYQAVDGKIVILGVAPDRAETGYGYIKTVNSNGLASDTLTVDAFVEKPNMVTAQRYISQGGYFWNAGIFVLKASVWLRALKHFRPDILDATREAWAQRSVDSNFLRPAKDEFSAIPSESIDYAVMEHCPGSSFLIEMVRLDAGWNDLGSWDAVWNVLPKDESGNAHFGDVLTTDTYNTLVHASSRLVSLVGVEDIVVIETSDAVLVADRSSSQNVKHIVNMLDHQQREEHALHRKVHRPWGWYDRIDRGGRFKVKHIMVNPGASLSLQMHNHRAEHWVVVKGTAEVTCGDTVCVLSENQSTYIPLGQLHRLANPGKLPLEIVEVQSGEYLGEDDIVRFEDHYGRID